MKKYLPLVILFLGILVVASTFYFIKIRGGGNSDGEDDEGALIEVSLEDRPLVSLTPTDDAHYLKLLVKKIEIKGAEVMEYELLYQTKEGLTQGTSGIVEEIGKKKEFETSLLLGSESSGKFRYDEGVETGTIGIKFRNSKGKLLVKFESDFHMQSSVEKLTSVDDKFNFVFEEPPGKLYFLTMNTIGIPAGPPQEIVNGPYGIFSSSEDKFTGQVSILDSTVFKWTKDSDWELQEDETNIDKGSAVFVGGL